MSNKYISTPVASFKKGVYREATFLSPSNKGTMIGGLLGGSAGALISDGLGIDAAPVIGAAGILGAGVGDSIGGLTAVYQQHRQAKNLLDLEEAQKAADSLSRARRQGMITAGKIGAGGLATVGALGGAAYVANRNNANPEANFGLLDKFSKTTQIQPSIEELRRTGSVAGGLTGSLLGNNIGVLGGGIAGASYNPDIVDEDTGEKRKLGLASRAALVLGGSSIGGLGGTLAGGGIGGSIGAKFPESSAITKLRNSMYNPELGHSNTLTRIGVLGA
jgi:hypothetical protein